MHSGVKERKREWIDNGKERWRKGGIERKTGRERDGGKVEELREEMVERGMDEGREKEGMDG